MQQVASRYALFSGCAAEGRGRPARHATIALARALHVELWEAPTKGCCGARADRRVDEAARRSALAPLHEGVQQGLDIICLSPACRRVVALNVPAASGGGPAGAPPRTPEVRDIVGLLAGDYGLARLIQQIPNALFPLRVALHSTCHGDHNPPRGTGTSQPQGFAALVARANPRRQKGDVPENPPQPLVADPELAGVVTAAGAQGVGDVSVAGRCTAYPLLRGLMGRSLGGSLAAPCLGLAAQAGADMVITPCFLCFVGLNLYQRSLRRGHPARSVPVMHLAQVLGVACEVAPGHLDLDRTTVTARRVLGPFVP